MSKGKFLILFIMSMLLLSVIFYFVAKPKTFTLSPIPQAHVQYLEQYGWHIAAKTEEREYYVTETPVTYTYKNNGLDLSPYEGKFVDMTTYLLKEREIYEGEVGKIYMSIYEFEGEIIGASGRLDNWTPGHLSVFDKEILLYEQRLK